MTEQNITPLPPGSCKHRPTSNGWSAGTGCAPYSWCGHCRRYIEHDAEWTAKFTTRGHTTLEEYARTLAAEAPALNDDQIEAAARILASCGSAS